MRDILSKVMTGSMVAGAALLVAACGGGSEANNTATDANLGATEYNTMPLDNTLPTDSNGLGGSNAMDSNASMGTDTGNSMANTTNAM